MEKNQIKEREKIANINSTENQEIVKEEIKDMSNTTAENQEVVKEEIKDMSNTTAENQEVVKEAEELTNIEEKNAQIIDRYKKKIAEMSYMFATLKVKYDDLSVLIKKTPELELVNNFFNSISCGDKGIENLLYEVMGYSLSKTAILNKAFIFKGNGRNGKSKIFRILEALLNNQCSHEHLESLSGSKAGSKTTIKNLSSFTVNISEDQKQPKYINTSYITRIISGEPIAVENGMKNSVFKPFATMLFSVNEVINFKQETGLYLTDRFIVIPFNATFTDDTNNDNHNIGNQKRDIHIAKKLCADLPLQIIATKAINAFLKALNNGKFTIPESVKKETESYFMESNEVIEFCDLLPIKTFIEKSQYYQKYRDWCYENYIDPLSNSQFGKQVISLGYRSERYSFEGKRNTYYVSSSVKNDDKDNVYNNFLLYKENSNETIEFKAYLLKQFDDESKLDDKEKVKIQDEQKQNNKNKIEDEQTIPEALKKDDKEKPFDELW